jgi:hypothetical protein
LAPVLENKNILKIKEVPSYFVWRKEARSTSEGMITRTPYLCWFTILYNKQLKSNNNTSYKENMQETPVNQIKHKKSLLALIFALLNLA